MPLITAVPFFVNVPQFDMFNLMYDTGTICLYVTRLAPACTCSC